MVIQELFKEGADPKEGTDAFSAYFKQFGQ